MLIKTINLYTYDELSEVAKGKARDWYRQAAAHDGNDTDYEYLKEDLTELLGTFGFTLGSFFYSGFSSKGDGASFTGSWSYKKGWRKAFLSAYQLQVGIWHEDNEDNKIILECLDAIAATAKKRFYNAWMVIKHSGSYCHENTMHSSDDCFDQNESDIVIGNFRRIAKVYYRKLEQAYDWRNADEQVAENIIVNEYTFTVDGKREEL